MRLTRSSKPSCVGTLAKWCFSSAVLIALILALTVAAPDQGPRAERVTPAGTAQVAGTQTAKGLADARNKEVASVDFLGLSGRLRAIMETPDALLQNPLLKPLVTVGPDNAVASWPKLTTPDGDAFTVVPLVPFGSARDSGFGR